MKKIITFTIGIFIGIILYSCESFVDIAGPKTDIMADDAFADDNTATASVVGIYHDMNRMNYQVNVLVTTLCALSADELTYLYTSVDYDQFKYNNLLATNSYLERMWNYSYSSIYSANACIEGLEATKGVTENLRRQLLGEAKFIRAFCHFYLVNLFGDVPFISGTDYKTNNTLPRTPKKEVFNKIIQDLSEAQELMQEEYQGSERIRPNKHTATALLARAYLYTEQWEKAEEEATKVIALNTVYILADLNEAFLKESKEAIWQLQAVNPGRNTWEGNIFCTPVPFYKLTDELINSFETNDKRFSEWVKEDTSVSPSRYCPFKYKVKNSPEVTEFCMVLRLGEQYLIRAEARANQNTTNSLTKAKEDINKIRERAGLDAYNDGITKDDLLNAIEHERQIELFSEWGHRWFDLKRTNRARTILSPIKTDWQDTDMLYLIPTTAIKTNHSLTQNPL